ncbi:hypothetical protein [Nocardia sp. NPDC051981]|uniref:hypothetical protein n=1 Tax=Nocardia sp. NPDC051981 TaxID=3155417 RepID=UPI00342398C8
MAFSWFRDTVVRLRAPLVTDAYGNRVRDWAAAGRVPMSGWRVQPVQGTRLKTAETIPREGLERMRRAFGPHGADVVRTDRIEWAGSVWEIDGDVDPWRGPSGRIAHIELMLTRVEG